MFKLIALSIVVILLSLFWHIDQRCSGYTPGLMHSDCIIEEQPWGTTGNPLGWGCKRRPQTIVSRMF